jgi:hypothetical protein
MNTIISFVLVLLCAAGLHAQPKLPGQWSLSFEGGFSLPASSAMRGTADEFRADLQKDYTNRRYPFGDKRSLTGAFGGMLSYRFPKSEWSAYGANHFYFSYTDNGFPYNSSLGQSASLFVSATSFGAEYTIGEASEPLNAFARAALALSLIGGQVNYFDYKTEIPAVFRGGIDVGVGGRWNWSFAPLALEGAVSYLNANLIGKNYEAPVASPPSTLRERALNDAANPNDPNDNTRMIAYLSFQLGLRLWF